jgi:hypothetical protein
MMQLEHSHVVQDHNRRAAKLRTLLDPPVDLHHRH